LFEPVTNLPSLFVRHADNAVVLTFTASYLLRQWFKSQVSALAAQLRFCYSEFALICTLTRLNLITVLLKRIARLL
jgi:hypothetical protein